jgi:NAD(P)-dependent dehydrogenase (short-subunit alcohol dehydrogenase family)
MASGTGLLDQYTLEWDAELLDLIGVEPERMSPIISLDSLSNEFRDPKLRGVRVLPAVGDGACSNLGAGCATPDRFALMVGTSGAERVVWAPERLQIPRGTWCYRVDERRVVLGGALNDGGSLFDWLRRALRLPALARAESELASLEPDAHGLTVLPFWGGERSPGWARDAQGAVVGLRLHTRPIDVLRAALEAIALRFGELDRALVEAMPTAGEVVATGAALLHSPAWMQIMADVLGRPCSRRLSSGVESGVALLALRDARLARPPLAEHGPDVTALRARRQAHRPLPRRGRAAGAPVRSPGSAMTDRLANTSVLITGAAGGIGAASARRLASDGAHLLLADLNGDAVADLARELGQQAIQVDVTRAADIQRMVDAAYERWGRLDVLFNNAGIAQARPLLDIGEAEWDRMMSVNLKAVFFVLQNVARRMLRQDPRARVRPRGKLVQTASIAGSARRPAVYRPLRGDQSRVISVTRTAALAFAGRGVTSNCICPGVVETAMWQQLDADWVEIEGWETGEAWRRRTASIPLGRPEQPSDVAAVLSFLASPDSDYMTGQAVVVDGGLNMG